ncbi:MAG: porin [Proteobacteria bacterium]|nr:porin [Pseudomonadota bacterium]
MRKILLATTAILAFAGAAQAAESPIQVTLGGSVDFRAAMAHESYKAMTNTAERRTGDFQTIYEMTVAAKGKAAGGIEYGALINLDNNLDRNATNDTLASMDMAYVWMSGAFGKVVLGDNHGASTLFVYAPTIGANQIDGDFSDYLARTDSYADLSPTLFSMTEDSTKVTYYTPKVGNENHKVQLGASFTPNYGEGVRGSDVVIRDAANSYKNMIEATAQYTGTFDPISVVVSPTMITAEGMGDKTVLNTGTRDFTAWGMGAQAMYAGFTLGGSYVDVGHMNTATTEDKDQNVWNIGLSYEMDKVELAANYMDAKAYSGNTYYDDSSAIGLGATYTWFPGLTTAADAVFFNQNNQATGINNEGHVLMLSQKMTF